MDNLLATTSFEYPQLLGGSTLTTETTIPPRQLAYQAIQLERVGAELFAHLQAQGISEAQVLSDFKAWRDRRRDDRRGR